MLYKLDSRLSFLRFFDILALFLLFYLYLWYLYFHLLIFELNIIISAIIEVFFIDDNAILVFILHHFVVFIDFLLRSISFLLTFMNWVALLFLIRKLKFFRNQALLFLQTVLLLDHFINGWLTTHFVGFFDLFFLPVDCGQIFLTWFFYWFICLFLSLSQGFLFIIDGNVINFE